MSSTDFSTADPKSTSRPTQNDLIPAVGQSGKVTAQSESLERLHHNKGESPDLNEKSPAVGVSNKRAGAFFSSSSEAPTNMSGPLESSPRANPKLKRARVESDNSRSSLRKPFRSPLMSKAGAGTSNNTGGSGIVEGASCRVKPISSTSHQQKDTSTATTTPSTTTSGSSFTIHTNSSATQRPGFLSTSKSPSTLLANKTPRHKKLLFRSPIVGHGSSSTNVLPSSAHSRLIERQALERRITDLRSRIRNGQLAVRFQESKEVPLEDLIEKWKRASQAGAEFLLEKYVEQEQIFGGSEESSPWGNNNNKNYNSNLNSNSFSSSAKGSQDGYNTSWGWDNNVSCGGDYAGVYGSSFAKQDAEMGSDRRDRWRAEEERMELEDVEHYLPTVEEALKSRCYSGTSQQARKPMTKMQKLLCAITVDPVTIGYDPETDSFSL